MSLRLRRGPCSRLNEGEKDASMMGYGLGALTSASRDTMLGLVVERIRVYVGSFVPPAIS